jgi:hypothetical protein
MEGAKAEVFRFSGIFPYDKYPSPMGYFSIGEKREERKKRGERFS